MSEPAVRVLLLEDDEDDYLLTQDLLSESQHRPFRLAWTDTLRKALQLLPESPPDVILLDLSLPDSTGLETFDSVYKCAPSVPIIVLSGLADEDTAVEAVHAGAQDYLVKGSVTGPQLRRAVRYAIERKRVEEQLRESRQQLDDTLSKLRNTQQQIIQHERLRALGQMAGGIAHELNNTLSPIVGFSDYLLNRPHVREDSEKLTRYLTRIHQAAQRAAETIRSLLEFYHPGDEVSALTPVSITDTFERVVNLSRSKWQDERPADAPPITIRVDVQPTVPIFMAYEADLRQALTNLLFNAVDAMPEGGTVLLAADKQEDCVVVTVRDTGKGMSGEVRERCVDPFFTTKFRGGSGLGLAMVYGIVQQHNGTMQIESTPGAGTTVSLSLPCARFAPDHGPTQPSDQPAERQRVLLVSNEAQTASVISEYLTVDAHEQTVARSEADAVELLRTQTFDVLIVDEDLPKHGSRSVAAEAGQSVPPPHVILLAGYGSSEAVATPDAGPFSAILLKPVTLTEFRNAFRQR